MYSSGYSQVNKYKPDAQKRMQYRSKGKSCGYYMRIVFFFSSLIQTLIIISLILFLIYGKKQDTTSNIQDLEKSFSQLSIENVGLRQQTKNLTNVLNVTLTDKARTESELKKFHGFINNSIVIIFQLQKTYQECEKQLNLCKLPRTFSLNGPPMLTSGCNCGGLAEQLKARLELVESNFTHTVQKMKMETDQTVKEKDDITLEAIQLRRDKSVLEQELQSYRQNTKDVFFHHLSGVSNVSKAFLQKIDSLFPTHLAFQLTCTKQREHLEQIHTNCTNLSREVEGRFQTYLNIVGKQVSDIQAENIHLKAENGQLSKDYGLCSQNSLDLKREHRQNLDKLQMKHDTDKEKLLVDKNNLNGAIDVLKKNITFTTKEVDRLKEQIKNLNMSCMTKAVSPFLRNTPPQIGLNPRPSSGFGTIPNGPGLSFAGGRTSGLPGGPINITQHLQELQRILKPPGPQEKPDLSKVLG